MQNMFVVLEHVEESSRLSLLRDRSVSAPHFSLRKCGLLDSRLDAHLDGLRIAGDAGWEIAAKELAWNDPGEVFTAAWLAFDSGMPQRIDAVLGVAIQSRELSRGAISALGWLELDQARPHIERLVRHPEPALGRIGLRAAAVQRLSPGSAFEGALRSGDPVLVAAALRAAGELGDGRLIVTGAGHRSSEDPQCRFWACWSLALAGDPVGLPLLSEVATSKSPRALTALDTAARRLPFVAAHSWQRDLAADPATLRTAIVLAGRIGDPAFVPWLIEQMAVPELARPAGEAFTFITGVDLAYRDLEQDRPEGFESGPTEDPEDPNVAMDKDEDLPWPNPGMITKWWSQNEHSFRPGVRHLVGRPIARDWLQQVLRKGKQRQRAAAALELHLLDPATPLFEVRAPGFRQRRMLGV